MEGIGVLRADAPTLFHGLTGRGLPLVAASALFGALSLLLLWYRRYTIVRVTAALAVVAVIWGWGAAQFPYLLEDSLTVRQAAADRATLQAMLISVSVGGALLVPSLAWLFLLFQRGRRSEAVGPAGG